MYGQWVSQAFFSMQLKVSQSVRCRSVQSANGFWRETTLSVYADPFLGLAACVSFEVQHAMQAHNKRQPTPTTTLFLFQQTTTLLVDPSSHLPFFLFCYSALLWTRFLQRLSKSTNMIEGAQMGRSAVLLLSTVCCLRCVLWAATPDLSPGGYFCWGILLFL